MAAGRNILGKLDTNYWINRINRSYSKESAIETISEMMDAANHLGITDSDQRAVVQAINAYGEKYGTAGLDRIYKIWDPNQNHINSLEFESSKQSWTEIAKNPEVQFSGESVPFVPFSGGSIGSNNNTSSTNVDSRETTDTKQTTQPTVNIGGGANPYKDLYNDLKADYKKQSEKIDQLSADLAELTRPKSADEVANELGIKYTQQDLLNMYNEDTNTFYDDLVKAQNETRDAYLRNSNQYINRTVQDYLDSYKYAAPTAVGKAAKAANALSINLYGSQVNSANDTGMLQSINNSEAARQKELAMNPYTAQDYYKTIRTALAAAGATRNYADAVQYQNKSNALALIDTANRLAAAADAEAAATKYSGLANAQGTYASGGVGSKSSLRQLYDYWYSMNNGDKTKTANNVLADLQGTGGVK